MTRPEELSLGTYTWEVVVFWKEGFWSLLEFTLQMVLILVFGHVLAISRPVSFVLDRIASSVQNNTLAVLLTGAVTMVAGYFNWGFGLIVGAILARKIGEIALQKGFQVNYPLVVASGYLGMMVWHGGLSGSAPLKVAEKGHFLEKQMGVVPIEQTVLSSFNVGINLVLFFTVMMALWWLSRKKYKAYPLAQLRERAFQWKGKDRLGWVVGGLVTVLALSEFFTQKDDGFSFISLNYINFLLFGLGMVFHGSIRNYIQATGEALRGAVGIILQFPFYAGILGVFKSSGLLVLIADYFVRISSPETFPVLAFISAGLINLFVPSGGGQWALQGPVIVEAASKMGLSLPKMVMALAYGDQLTNMLQPFWALPLLAISGVAPKELLRYTLYFFLLGAVVLGFGIFLVF
ncbi:short-chain fatty acid transporter [Echinicola sediminis]